MSRTAVAVLTAVALVATACTNGGGATSGPVTGAAEATQGTWDINETDPSKVKDGGELKWPLDALVDNWNPHHVDGNAQGTFDIVNAITPNLFRVDKSGKVSLDKDYLDSAELTSTDPQVVTLRLNPRARWSNGRQFSWEDVDAQVKATSGADPKFAVAATTGSEDIGSVRRGANDQEVIVTFKNKFAEWQLPFGRLLPKELNATSAEFNSGWKEAPKITAGPFKIGTINRTAQVITIVRDDAWWGERAKLDRITFRVIARTSWADSLANGAIDWCRIGSSVDLYQRTTRIQGVTIRQAPSLDYNHLTFNGAPTSLLADPRMRVALMKGIDTSTITKGVLGPIVADPQRLGNHFYMRGTPNYQDHSAAANFDPEAAKRALDELGWRQDGQFRKKDGRQLDVRLLSAAGVPISEQIGKLIQAQLAAIGVNVVIDNQSPQAFFEDFVTPGNFDMVSFSWNTPIFPISGSKGIYYLDPQAVKQNFGRVGSDEINAKYNQANAEFDEGKRIALAQDIDKLLWAEGHTLPIYQIPGTRAVRGTVANFGSFGTASVDYARIGFTG
ncbi:ABC transporter family substrate-binding protein [Kibdelosporangium philippinense]|uniref:ABC transporter family substrate-binding protein n=1 Tax=Kibdelosporangium philippinense TaxID=211113 RepID=A0ABS8Z985_9PSEU|nr:ABC transporter family substrate-binding protein [Kibdelosporangium philippinense]MCE7003108.1 ABC transporter family substrate-binding protein [Kibdelosporangium philippinense]